MIATAAKYLIHVSLGLLLMGGAPVVQSDSLAINNVHIVSSTGKKPDTRYNVLVEDGRISAISQEPLKADNIIDGDGRFLAPGLIDSHVHLDGIPGYQPATDNNSVLAREARAQIPKSYLYFGFTTVLDLAAQPEFINRWNKQEIAPEARFCAPVPIPNGYPLAWLPEDQRYGPEASRYMLYDERQADVIPKTVKPKEHSPEAVVKRIKADGAVCVKVFYETGFGRLKNLPVPTRKMIDELVAAARNENLPVFFHGNSEAAYRFALDTDVDVIVHGMWHWDDLAEASEKEKNKFFSRVIQSGKKIQPTIQVIHGEREMFNPEFFSHPDIRHVMPQALIEWYRSDVGQWMKKTLGREFGEVDNLDERSLYQKVTDAYKKPLDRLNQFTRAVEENLIFGSDTPSGPFYTQFPGLNGRLEIQRWIKAGVGPITLFNALTLGNARVMGLEEELGSVEVGKVANLLLMTENPLLSEEAYDSIEIVILRGRAINRQELSSSTGAPSVLLFTASGPVISKML